MQQRVPELSWLAPLWDDAVVGPRSDFIRWEADPKPDLLDGLAPTLHVASPSRRAPRAPFRAFGLSVGIDFFGALKVA